MVIFSIASRVELPPSKLPELMINAIMMGVRKIPKRLEAAALQIAAGTFPRARDTNAIEDWTVEGSAHRYKMPMYSSSPITGERAGRRARPTRGNRMNVALNTVRCSFQCPAPASTACWDNLAPCMKKSSAIEILVNQEKATATSPEHGSREATATVAKREIVKLSGNHFGLAIKASHHFRYNNPAEPMFCGAHRVTCCVG